MDSSNTPSDRWAAMTRRTDINATNRTTLRASIQDVVERTEAAPMIDGDVLGFDLTLLPAHTRLQMETIARNTSSPEEALGPMIEVLIVGSEDKRTAIKRAFQTNTPLREQWERAYETLRAPTT